MKQQPDISYLLDEIDRIKAHIGIPDDDWKSPSKALKAMGIDRSVDWLRDLLQRADYADGAGEECSLIKGEHFTVIDGSWMVNATKIKPVLLSGDGKMVLPKIPVDYAV